MSSPVGLKTVSRLDVRGGPPPIGGAPRPDKRATRTTARAYPSRARFRAAISV